MAIMHFPHPTNKKIKRVHRIVVLPDYQGIGIGMRFMNIVCEFYNKQRFKNIIVLSAKNMIGALTKSNLWRAYRFSVSKPSKTAKKIGNHVRNVKTAAFYYVGEV